MFSSSSCAAASSLPLVQFDQRCLKGRRGQSCGCCVNLLANTKKINKLKLMPTLILILCVALVVVLCASQHAFVAAAARGSERRVISIKVGKLMRLIGRRLRREIWIWNEHELVVCVCAVCVCGPTTKLYLIDNNRESELCVCVTNKLMLGQVKQTFGGTLSMGARTWLVLLQNQQITRMKWESGESWELESKLHPLQFSVCVHKLCVANASLFNSTWTNWALNCNSTSVICSLTLLLKAPKVFCLRSQLGRTQQSTQSSSSSSSRSEMHVRLVSQCNNNLSLSNSPPNPLYVHATRTTVSLAACFAQKAPSWRNLITSRRTCSYE